LKYGINLGSLTIFKGISQQLTPRTSADRLKQINQENCRTTTKPWTPFWFLRILRRIMRFAIFGDIHANLEAFEAVLEDARNQGCTHYICLGDIVGYNANPRECLRLVRSLNCPVVKGNHDDYASADFPLGNFNPLAEFAIQWTRDQLTEEEKQWLRELPLIAEVHGFTIVHATLDAPENWFYVLNQLDAAASFVRQSTELCFFGHTHAPRADGDWRASYGIYDVESRTVQLRRIRYDLGATQKKILAAALPPRLADRLAVGK
jgi:predicted phosphodiesterase